MAIQLEKGGNISLDKIDPSFKNINVGLGWDVPEAVKEANRLGFDLGKTEQETFDLDASIMMVASTGKARSDQDFIYYQKDHRKSVCGSIYHTGDNRTGAGEGDDESIHVFLNKVPNEIQKLIICVTIHEGEIKKQNFGQVTNAFIRLVNKDTDEEVVRYDLSEEASTYTGIIFGEIYRYNGEWKFKAVGRGFHGGLEEFVRMYGLDTK
jgi:tellurium resistance protein TerD